jgi:hypothetical protein
MPIRRRRIDPKDRIGTQTYSDCHFTAHPDETIMACVTWANHCDFRIGEVRPTDRRNSLNLHVDLEESSVERLHTQLGDWLAHRKDERRMV